MRPYKISNPDRPVVSRREQLLAEAARLFAAHGFRGVGINDIGAAVGISGPGIYRHFSSKEEILAALLVGISQYLHDGGEGLAERFRGLELLDELIAFHLDFSLTYRDLIVLHDRDLDSLERASRDRVRRLQRAYVTTWVEALRDARLDIEEKEAGVRAHACFGLLNSTPHLDPAALGPVGRDVLAAMARAALLA
jgi:AcrR family transcriptional regulator